MSKNQK
jgi:hypothetical protein